jgi:alkanesulfonate monooxygenase SsuD/methylene tetrahydromethanopterin reductase-like flavin-dependent oxidoreductase (luciferase family)
MISAIVVRSFVRSEGSKRRNLTPAGGEEWRMKKIEFGLLLHTRNLVQDTGKANFQSFWQQARDAEAAGFDHVWLGDSVTVLDRARGDCLTTMAALAVATNSIGIGTVPLLMSLRNPVLLAHSLATIDVISNGRLRLGVSAGPVADYIRRQFDACGVPGTEKAGRLSEAIVLARRLWSEDRVTFAGRYYRLENTGILPKPIQSPIPIWVAAGDNEAALRRVARLGDGWVTTENTVDGFARLRRRIDDYAEAAGRNPASVAPTMLYAAIRLDRDGEAARAAGWAWMETFFRQPRDRLGHHTAIFGSPQECAEKLTSYAAAGMTCLVARIASDDAERQSDLLLNGVKPRLAAALGKLGAGAR